jgi:hypothetical protein
MGGMPAEKISTQRATNAYDATRVKVALAKSDARSALVSATVAAVPQLARG